MINALTPDLPEDSVIVPVSIEDNSDGRPAVRTDRGWVWAGASTALPWNVIKERMLGGRIIHLGKRLLP